MAFARVVALLPLLALVGCRSMASSVRAGAPTTPSDVKLQLGPSISATELEGHVRFLASDELGGRATGTPQGERAARYLAEVLARYGLRPGGDGGTFLQAVPLVRQTTGRRRLARPSKSADGAPQAATVVAHNVVGILPGVGTSERPELAREAIVLSAHYDHLGTREAPKGSPAGEDVIFNGADDDASGTAAVLEIAGALAAGAPPVRTVIFLLATGEEMGLLGTSEYLDRPPVPLAQTVFNLNFEMLGRPDEKVGPGFLWLTGYQLTDVGPAWSALGLSVKADPRPEMSFFRRSDNIAFVRKGVVGQTLSSYGMHTDYHRPSDEPGTLDYQHLQRCARAAFQAVRALSHGAQQPRWTGDWKAAAGL